MIRKAAHNIGFCESWAVVINSTLVILIYICTKLKHTNSKPQPSQSREPLCVTLARQQTMRMKLYDIFLDNNKIGTTELEKGDAPMGCVFGKITFINISSGYELFKNYCVTHEIELVNDYPEDRLILTRTINNLAVKNELGIEIKGLGNQISGMDSEEFEISLEGVPYPFYEEEFPHHVKAYDNQFNNEQ